MSPIWETQAGILRQLKGNLLRSSEWYVVISKNREQSAWLVADQARPGYWLQCTTIVLTMVHATYGSMSCSGCERSAMGGPWVLGRRGGKTRYLNEAGDGGDNSHTIGPWRIRASSM